MFLFEQFRHSNPFRWQNCLYTSAFDECCCYLCLRHISACFFSRFLSIIGCHWLTEVLTQAWRAHKLELFFETRTKEWGATVAERKREREIRKTFSSQTAMRWMDHLSMCVCVFNWPPLKVNKCWYVRFNVFRASATSIRLSQDEPSRPIDTEVGGSFTLQKTAIDRINE